MTVVRQHHGWKLERDPDAPGFVRHRCRHCAVLTKITSSGRRLYAQEGAVWSTRRPQCKKP